MVAGIDPSVAVIREDLPDGFQQVMCVLILISQGVLEFIGVYRGACGLKYIAQVAKMSKPLDIRECVKDPFMRFWWRKW